jgi:hypothetical protein
MYGDSFNQDVWKAIASERAASYRRDVESEELARRQSTPVAYQIGHTISRIGHTLIRMGERMERTASEPCPEEYTYQTSSAASK